MQRRSLARRCAACVLLWLALAAPCTTTALGFIGSSCVSSRGAAELRTTLGVRERRVSLHRKGPTGGKTGSTDIKAQARALNSQIKQADSATELIAILKENVDAGFFDSIHASTAYHKLATFFKSDGFLPSICSGGPALVKLQARTEAFIKKGQVDSWAFANVMWAMAVLHRELPLVMQLLPSMVTAFSVKTLDMAPQALSICLWAAVQLKDVAPEALKIVPALVSQIPGKASDMTVQALSNTMEGLVSLQDSLPSVKLMLTAPASTKEDFVRFAALKVSEELLKLAGDDLQFAMPVVVWGCARSGRSFDVLLTAVGTRLTGANQLSPFPDWGVCALLWSYQALDTTGQFAEFQEALKSEVKKRKLSDSDVERSQVGYLEWSAENES